MARQAKPFPNIVIWAWMRNVLGLCGTELMIFAYLFSQTFDSVHRCYTALSDMEEWFGVTRQTISRNIDRLVENGFVVKECKREESGFLKHNNYAINTETVVNLCEASDYDNYKNFIQSYGMMLKERYPQDSANIDDYMSSLLAWHMNKNIEIRITLNEIANLLSSDTSSASLTEALEAIRKVAKKPERKRNNIVKHTQNDSDAMELFKTTTKRKSRTTKARDKYALTVEFITVNAGGNQELQTLLLNFLETQSGRAFSVDQWRCQLNTLLDGCGTVDRMIESVRNSYVNNYRALYYEDRSLVDMKKKMDAITEYVESDGEGNDHLKDALIRYVTETPKGKSYTIGQFTQALRTLSSLCKTLEQKIASVEKSYENSYSALAYPNYGDTACQETDIDKKHEAVDKFISDGSYYLVTGLKEALYSYIDTTKTGKSMSINLFTIALDGLRLYCFDDDEKIIKVNMAIQNNSAKFATEDFEETRRLKAKLTTRSKTADNLDRARKQKVVQYKMKHLDDPRVASVVIPTFTEFM